MSHPRVLFPLLWFSGQELLKDPILDPHHLFSVLVLGGNYS